MLFSQHYEKFKPRPAPWAKQRFRTVFSADSNGRGPVYRDEGVFCVYFTVILPSVSRHVAMCLIVPRT